MLAKTGTTIHHISNNAPTGMAGPDEEARRAGLEVAKKWLDGAAIIGAKSMRVNSGGPSYLPNATKGPDGYPKNDEIVPYLRTCIESFKEMADHGGKVGVKVTLENHWGLTANPANMLVILDEVNHPFCEASPDYANWEHEYMLFSGLRAVAPYTHTTVHAKYWDRWTNNDIQRSTRIMMASGFEGKYALEYESGPWDGVEGVRYLLKGVMAALTSGSGDRGSGSGERGSVIGAGGRGRGKGKGKRENVGRVPRSGPGIQRSYGLNISARARSVNSVSRLSGGACSIRR